MHRILNQDLLIDNILVTEQYGFRNVISTEYATFRLTDSISKSIMKKKMHVGGRNGMVMPDLSKEQIC